MALAAPSPAAPQALPVAADCPAPGHGQANVGGGVHDLLTRVPLQNATVTLLWERDGRRHTATAKSDGSGQFSLCLLPAGELITIQAEFQGRSGAPEGRRLSARGSEYVDLPVPVVHSAIAGTAADAGTGEGVAGIVVRLGGTRLETVTSRDGHFRFPRVPPGRYVLELNHVAYAERRDSVTLQPAADAVVVVTMAPAAIALEPIRVETRMHRLQQAGFYSRAARGIGRFVMPDEVDRLRPTLVSDLVRTMPEVRLALRSGDMGYDVLTRGYCQPGLVVDGMPGMTAIDEIPAIWVQALEVYPSRGTVPPQYRVHSTRCGVILLWTRTSLPGRG
ncbi:MAG TPA: carboxypeptidase regulatory-like domain-containing protein [Longimicrobiales bacterium]|nr:carboxypeptidase regulatory-like domain-containing protein [Longimicrobiales bacterium]